MLILTIKFMFLLFGFFLAHDYNYTTIIALLLSITLTSFNQYINHPRLTLLNFIIYSSLCLLFPCFIPFISVLFFDLLLQQLKLYAFLILVPLLAAILEWKKDRLLLLILILLFVILLHYLITLIKDLQSTNKQIRDSNTEQALLLKEKNRELLNKQNNEIHLATLKERNRIARDIHDYVGHDLSRAILLTGAIQTLNHDKNLIGLLASLRENLTASMNSIRESVHDLKEDSIDLKIAIKQLFRETPHELTLQYDMATTVPNSIKYCFLTVTKEALTNITKHSNATSIQMTVQEHPALYQLLIHDNGSKPPDTTHSGMGLVNIEERVQTLNGYCSFSYENGFRIFISIPKTGGTKS